MSRTTRRDCDDYKNTIYGNPDHRDRKPWYKPTSWFKKLMRRYRRHKMNQALREGREVLPKFKHIDVWDWT